MATLTKQLIVRAALTPTYAAAAGGGDEFLNTGAEFLLIKNGDSSSTTLTIVTQATVDSQAVGDRTVTIPAGEERMVGPFTRTTYNDGTGKCQLTYSSVTALTIAILSF
jgi:hypothetical protein